MKEDRGCRLGCNYLNNTHTLILTPNIEAVIFHWDAGEWNWMLKAPSSRLPHSLKIPHPELSVEIWSKIIRDFRQQGV